MFSSRTAESFDPEPYVDADGRRSSTTVPGLYDRFYSPRPEFAPTRDPEPWVDAHGGNRHGPFGGWSSVWLPRPEFARPDPNPILVDYRNSVSRTVKPWLAADWAEKLDHGYGVGIWGATPAQINHARRVLTLLSKIGD